ncbi:MAG: sulfotransferase family 2 domain-containing protein [Actinomycetota bacterium]
MPVISWKHRYLFLMAPGTGSTAVGQGALISQLDGEFFPPEDVLDENGYLIVSHKHAPLGQLLSYGLLTREQAATMFTFSSVRNPFDALVSQYLRLRTKWKEQLKDPSSFVHRQKLMYGRIRLATELSFPDWVEEKLLMRGLKQRIRHGFRRYRSPRHMFARYVKGSDYIMRFECLQDDFNEALRRIGIAKSIEIPRLNVSEGRDSDYRTYYTSRARAIVEDVYAPDLLRFGYRFNQPQQPVALIEERKAR